MIWVKIFLFNGYKYSQRLEVNDLISLVWEMKSTTITEEEKRIIYSILNNEEKKSPFKYEKIRKFFNIFKKNKLQIEESKASYDFTGLLDKGLIELEAPPGPQSQDTDNKQNQSGKNYKLTNKGLLHIFNGKFIYSPSLLVKYHDDIVLSNSLYKYFELKTIRSSSAKFFVLISEYLYDIASYLLGYRHSTTSRLTIEIQKDIEHNLNLIALYLGFKIAIQYKESNLISATIENPNDKAVLAIFDMEMSMKKKLSKDPKLLDLIVNVFDELSKGREELLSLSRVN